MPSALEDAQGPKGGKGQEERQSKAQRRQAGKERLAPWKARANPSSSFLFVLGSSARSARIPRAHQIEVAGPLEPGSDHIREKAYASVSWAWSIKNL